MELEAYIDKRLAEVGGKLDLLRGHREKEMKFPLVMRRMTFLTFIYEEEAKYQPLFEELRAIKEMIKS